MTCICLHTQLFQLEMMAGDGSAYSETKLSFALQLIMQTVTKDASPVGIVSSDHRDNLGKAGRQIGHSLELENCYLGRWNSKVSNTQSSKQRDLASDSKNSVSHTGRTTGSRNEIKCQYTGVIQFNSKLIPESNSTIEYKKIVKKDTIYS